MHHWLLNVWHCNVKLRYTLCPPKRPTFGCHNLTSGKTQKHENHIFSLKCCITAIPDFNQSLLDFYNLVDSQCILFQSYNQCIQWVWALNCYRVTNQEKKVQFCTVLNTRCTCTLPCWKTKLSYVSCLTASNICWDTKIFQQHYTLTFTPGLIKNNSHFWHRNQHCDRLQKRQFCGTGNRRSNAMLPS